MMQHVRRYLKYMILSCAVMASGAAHAGRTVYKCPYLEDEGKMTISPMVQGYNGWFFRLKGDLREDFELFSEASTYMHRMVEAFKQRGTTVVFLSIPSKGIVAGEYLNMDDPKLKRYQQDAARSSYGRFVESLRKTGVITPDLQDALEKQGSRSAEFFFARDHHWRSTGARMAARALGELIRANPAYKALTPVTYATKETGTQYMKHKMALELQRLCATEMTPEEYPRFATTLESNGGTGDDALFGDVGGESDPSVLVGSSFSAEQEFNFDGFLSEYTGLSIANHAISGGLLYNSIISYTSSEPFERERPPFLIWEAPAIYNLNENTSTAFRQIIPALYGECQGEHVVAKSTQLVKAGNVENALFSFKPEQKISGGKYYLFLSSPNRSFTSFTLSAEYDDGDGEWFSVDRQEFFDNSGRFFIELSDEIESNLLSFSIDRASNVNTTLTAKLCRVPDNATSPKEM